MRLSTSIAILCAALGCDPADDATEVVLVVDSDLATPDELDAIQVTVTDPLGNTMSSRADLGVGEARLPRTVGILNDTQRLGPYTVDVRAVKNSAIIVRRRAVFSFERDRIRRLRINLLRACGGVVCSGEQTCLDDGSCGSTAVSLDDWTGSVAPLMSYDGDASMSDAGMDGDL